MRAFDPVGLLSHDWRRVAASERQHNERHTMKKFIALALRDSHGTRDFRGGLGFAIRCLTRWSPSAGQNSPTLI